MEGFPAKRAIFDEGESSRKKIAVTGPSGSGTLPVPVVKIEPGVNKPIDRAHTDTVLNFLLRLACQVSSNTFNPIKVLENNFTRLTNPRR